MVALQSTFKASTPGVCRCIIQKMFSSPHPPFFFMFFFKDRSTVENLHEHSSRTKVEPHFSFNGENKTHSNCPSLPHGSHTGRQHAWEAGVRLQGCFSFAILWLWIWLFVSCLKAALRWLLEICSYYCLIFVNFLSFFSSPNLKCDFFLKDS